ncbi:MAG: hypothetical protein JW940_10440, partial [Polyangiaceae bacterium]|nr:hypothetical protein [Polyangiaceae bacterium]
EAPVSELSECVLTFANHCVPAHTGCRRYLDTPGCDGTMIIDNGGCYRNDVSVTGVPIRVRREDTSDWRVPPGTGLDTNPTECPAVAVAVGSPCENEALTCEYGGTDPLDTRKSGKGTEYKTECWCVPTGATELAWDCGDTLEHDIGDCPSTPPETGASCEDTPHASRCSYAPRREYSCGDDEKWEQISPAALPELPASPDRTTLVAELSDPDQSDWCSWLRETFGEATGESEPKPVPADESGFVDVSQYFGIFDDAISLEALLPNWPVDECEKNLSVSSCEAPISELSGCVVSLLNSGTPSPTGCRRYLETPGCFATVVYDIEGVDPDVLMLPDYVEGYRPVPLRVEAPETAAGS